MDTPDHSLRTYFSKLGLEADIADIYLALHANGPQSISELSRSAGVERTRIYRLIDRLLASNLVEVEPHQKRGVMKAAPVANLRILIDRREADLRNLRDELELIEQVVARNSLSNPSAHLQLYTGPEGLRQLLQTVLEATGTVYMFQRRPLMEIIAPLQISQWLTEAATRNLALRLLVNDSYAAACVRLKQPSFEKLPENVQRRRVETSTYKIAVSLVVYDDAIACLHWGDGNVSAYTIHDRALSAMQRQMADNIWLQSDPASQLIQGYL